ncbi:MAG: type II toxin-antitoxin system RelE/ParE family toxin [Pseudomonadota bacterium]
MRRLIITDPARDDLADIRRYTRERWGDRMLDAYDILLKQALLDIRDDPNRPGSKDRSDDLLAPIRSYHVALSRGRAGSRIKAPRHVLLYFEPKEDTVVLSRVLHDSRDLARHLPDAHWMEAKGESGG